MAPEPVVDDEIPWFSFFVTSLEGLQELSGSPDGFGGDLGGLAGADTICKSLALRGNPTDAKEWRAFLSTSGARGGERVDAIDRIGEGPWYDYNGRLLAENLDGLQRARPNGDAQLSVMFTDEFGGVIRARQTGESSVDNSVDNHDMLTGSGTNGRLYTDDGMSGELATCGDWTDATLRTPSAGGGGMMGGAFGGGFGFGRVPVGHAWPRSQSNGLNWINDHTVNGCEPGVNIFGMGGAAADDFTVGGGGGYGGFYCFALGAVAP